jgi:thiamine-monophosphate kinase
MLIKKIGEFGLIERFRRMIKTDSSVVKGSGDDCAVLKLDNNHYQLYTCDMLVQDVDFSLKDKPYLIGRKSLAVQISDIAACGGLPRHCLISLSMPSKTKLKFVDKLFNGMLDTAKEYNINIVGGDLSRGKQLAIDVSMLGIVEKRNLVLRSGARPGEIIFVTGKLGGSIRGKHLTFKPRLKEARFLVKNFKVSSMIDISDGLAQDLGHILEQSSAGAVIYEKLIPQTKQARNLNEVLFMGEDFELIFTLSNREAKKLLDKKISGFKPIGEIVSKEKGLQLIDKTNRERIIEPKGFRHF